MTDLPSKSSSNIGELLATANKSSAPSQLSLDQALEVLDGLEAYECWEPYLRLIEKLLNQGDHQTLVLYKRLARTQFKHLEDTFGAAETCGTATKNLALSYKECTEDLIPFVIGSEDFSAEASILLECSDLFPEPLDQIKALERLCFLYEKKIHNDILLAKTFERLLAADRHNIKALRYFKLLYTQNAEWEDVANVLRILLGTVTHPQEIYRYAQELAAVNLYQLDNPKEALKTLNTYCSESPLDMSTILYDAYDRLNDYNGCLRILRETLLSVGDEISRAKIHYKMGQLYQWLHESSAALDQYKKAAELWPSFLEAAEGVITIALDKKDWNLVDSTLESLEKTVVDERLRVQVQQARRRIKDGIRHASNN